jgi:hypothetical protein
MKKAEPIWPSVEQKLLKEDETEYTLEEFEDRLDLKLSEAYGVDFMKVTRLERAGLLNRRNLTNEILESPEFKYEPEGLAVLD